MSDQAPPPPPAPGDRRSAKADVKAAKAREKALRPWYKKKRFMIPLVLIVLIAIGGALGGGDDEGTDVASGGDSSSEATSSGDDEPDTFSSNEENRPQDDIDDVRCVRDEFGFAEAEIDITNNSSGRSTYFIDVSFETEDGGRQIATGIAVINNLEPGQSTTETASSLEEIDEAFSCRVTEINRTSS